MWRLIWGNDQLYCGFGARRSHLILHWMSAQGSVRFRWGTITGPYHANFSQVETQKFDPHWFYCLQWGCNNLFCQECIMDKWENMLNLTHTLDKIYLTGILLVQCLQISLHNDDNEMKLYTNKRIRSAIYIWQQYHIRQQGSIFALGHMVLPQWAMHAQPPISLSAFQLFLNRCETRSHNLHNICVLVTSQCAYSTYNRCVWSELGYSRSQARSVVKVRYGRNQQTYSHCFFFMQTGTYILTHMQLSFNLEISRSRTVPNSKQKIYQLI